MRSVALLGMLGCGTTPPGQDRHATAGVDPRATPVRAREIRSSWAREPTPPSAGARHIEATPEPLETIEERVERPVPPPAPRPRNLSDELRDAIGDISGCLDVETAARIGSSLSVAVRATALPSGRLQRATVTAPSLPASAVSCIRDLAEAASLPTPVDGAPRTVSTTLRFSVSAQRTVETRTRFADDEPIPGRARSPAVVLPALGPPGPAPGARAPAIELPALGPSEPPAGYVPPAHTLPAQGPPVRR